MERTDSELEQERRLMIEADRRNLIEGLRNGTLGDAEAHGFIDSIVHLSTAKPEER